MSSALLPAYARLPLKFEHASGAYIYDSKGDAYLDFGAGIAVNSLGHTHPVLVKALKDQAERLWHTSNLYHIPGGERLAARLVAETFADRVFFTNSGAEAVEGAIKTARKYHAEKGAAQRYRIITFEGAFHGRTLATIAAGGKARYLEGFGPPVDGFDQAPFGDLKATEALISDQTAAILIEPVQGEGGIRIAEHDFLRGLEAMCREHGLLLVLDEVQSGVGRTGKLFAHEWAGITPDIMAIAKGIGGGFPLGAFLASESAAAGMTAGTHGSTFGGNPLAMAVGNAVLDVVLADGFLDRVNEAGLKLSQKLARLKDEHKSIIEQVRGTGLMLGLKCKCPAGDLVKSLIDEKMLAIGAGENVVRLLPPLTITDEDIDQAMTRLDAACRRLEHLGHAAGSD